jgi:hypothetical protein
LSLTGGCQCGAIRFRVDGAVRHASVCHCRMCQKATGSPIGAFASVRTADLVWTRGARKTFQSSNAVARGFCGDCGTPLTFEAAEGGNNIALTLAAFDDPSVSELLPTRHLELASRIPWMADLHDLPPRSPTDQAAQEAKYGPRTSHQHPDHETAIWPPASSARAPYPHRPPSVKRRP